MKTTLGSLSISGKRFYSRAASGWLVVFLAFFVRGAPFGAEFGDGKKRALENFEKAQAEHETKPGDPEAAWKFGRACFDWSRFVEGKTALGKIAKLGASACRKAIALAPEEAAAHHYLAMNLGQLARTQLIGALKLVDEMERLLKRAVELDGEFHYAVSERSLGLLYSQAPGWPISVGNRQLALKHLQNAVRISPDYPENRLCLIEVALESKDQNRVRLDVQEMEDRLPAMRSKFSGDAWEDDWKEWDARWERILSTAGSTNGSSESRKLKHH